MSNAPIRFAAALLWPLTVWTSLTHLEEHPVDDYVERTTPIVASAIGFWLGVAALIVLGLTMQGRPLSANVEDAQVSLRIFDQRWGAAVSVLGWLSFALYVIGFWLYTARDEAFRPSRLDPAAGAH